jgi:AraC-like DNA-binding protein
MSLAARRLGDGDATVHQIAQEVGYDSEFAFARAFKRATGTAPGQYRKLAQTTDRPLPWLLTARWVTGETIRVDSGTRHR